MVTWTVMGFRSTKRDRHGELKTKAGKTHGIISPERAKCVAKRLFCLDVDPYLPENLRELTLRRVEVGKASVDLRFWREGDMTCWHATVQSGEFEVKKQAWQPYQ